MGGQNTSRAFGFFLAQEKISFFKLLRPYWFSLGYGCALLFCTNLITALLPILINGGVTVIQKHNPFVLRLFSLEINFTDIYWILLTVTALALVGAVLRTLSRMAVFDAGRLVERDLRSRLFFHTSILDDSFFLQHSVGDLMNHLTTDMANVRMVTGFAALNIMNIIFVFCFTVPLLLKIDVMLSICALLPFPCIIIAVSGISKKLFLATIDYQKQLSHMVSHVQENLLGAHVVRLFHKQVEEGKRFKKTNSDTLAAGIRLARVRAWMLPMMRLMVGVAVGLVLYVGGTAMITGRISLGDFVEVNARILQLSWPAMSVGFVMSVYSRGQASLSRINDLLAAMPIIKDGDYQACDVQTIDVHHLSLTPYVKNPISFQVRRGQMLGIVGPSGSYKTSLLRVLCRRISAPVGSVFYDGRDINDVTLSSIYNQISVVFDESFLFHTSIKSNICFARPDASDAEIDEVIRLVRLDRDFLNFTDGIDTIIGERGITLSGGQRQRVLLARALLAKRPVMIMDDALSSVDADTERHIVLGLRDYLKDSLIIIATHRLSAIRNAEEILVMDKGRVIQSGTHQALLRGNGLYQQLWGLDQSQGLVI